MKTVQTDSQKNRSIQQVQHQGDFPLQLARWVVYLIVVVLSMFNVGFAYPQILYMGIIFGMMLVVDLFKYFYETRDQRIYFWLHILNFTLAFIYGFISQFELYIIFYFVYIVEYHIVMHRKRIGYLIALIYLYLGVFYYLMGYTITQVLFSGLVTTAQIIFAMVLSNLVLKQIQEKEKITALQVQLIQKEKMASLGQLTAGLVHEINSPLGVINSNSGMITMLVEMAASGDLPAEKQSSSLQKINTLNQANVNACQQIVDIVKKLKTFSRLDESEWQLVDIHEGIDSVLSLTIQESIKDIKIHKDYGQVPAILCIPSLINQMVMNLLINAVEALEAGKGDIYITTRSDNKYLYLTVRDTGKGISKTNQNSIFDPGFTTKGVGIGTGLGLSITYNIIEKHNGEITFKSKEGQGTEFIVKLPLGDEKKYAEL